MLGLDVILEDIDFSAESLVMNLLLHVVKILESLLLHALRLWDHPHGLGAQARVPVRWLRLEELVEIGLILLQSARRLAPVPSELRHLSHAVLTLVILAHGDSQCTPVSARSSLTSVRRTVKGKAFGKG